ncbi:MAG: hypothetical protein MR727_07245 [Lentisphaeria bacterium]|nr:hypothetical protein [Lentisphaeria bacterium]
MDIEKKTFFLVDLDGTLSAYREGALLPDKLFLGNFLFPVIRDQMMKNGWKRNEAENAIRKLTEENIFWDYSDFIAEFNLPISETLMLMLKWHQENIVPCNDGIACIKRLHAAGKKLFVMSNNPYLGCLFKLQAVGLADNFFSSPYFCRIFGTNVLRGCKSQLAVWKRALAQIPASPEDVCVIGDNPREDRDIPEKCGILSTHLFIRDKIIHGVERI